MRKPFIAGNWKMNTDCHSAPELVRAVGEGLKTVDMDRIDVAVIPPFVYLAQVVSAARALRMAVGAQDLFYEKKGAFTGEISACMIKDVGCNYCLCGHSERRHVIGEQDELVNKKVTAAITGGLLPILCVGELLAERESGKTEQVVERQIRKGFAGLSVEKARAVTVAYEPVWAIGTGKTATSAQAQEVHAMIRALLGELYDRNFADGVRIQYGGSVKAGNAAELMQKEDIDGLLVGGASLVADEFLAIVRASVAD